VGRGIMFEKKMWTGFFILSFTHQNQVSKFVHSHTMAAHDSVDTTSYSQSWINKWFQSTKGKEMINQKIFLSLHIESMPGTFHFTKSFLKCNHHGSTSQCIWGWGYKMKLLTMC
jgi:hypothetical protein